MNVLTKTSHFLHVLHWRLTWNRRDTRKAYTVPDNPKFMNARDAVKRIRPGDVVAVAGLAGNQRASILYWAMRELYEESGEPHDLTVLCIGGQGGRGRVPGTVEELGVDGLVTRLITGHVETFKSFLQLADDGRIEIQVLPQGILALLIGAQTRGEDHVATHTGVGTFVDPRVGRGTPLDDDSAEQWVAVEGDALRYRMPKINVAMFNVPAADRDGNLYVKHAAMFGASREMAHAAKKHNGLVIANVGLIVDKGYDEVFLPGDMVDAIVGASGTEQVASVPHRKYWPMFTLDSTVPVTEGVAQLKFFNWVLGITPRRTAADAALARLAASVFVDHLFKGALVNVGTGLPEEVCRLLAEAGLADEITLLMESGVIGGVPAPGVFFGAAVSPREMVSPTEVFERCYQHLDATILGVLQADSDGHVNVSKRGEGAINYVGPGGFMDFTAAASTVIFVSSWMAHGRVEVEGDRVRVAERGKPKFVEAVDEITFNGQRALEDGKQVFYVTHVGVFELTDRGMTLVRVMPGIDIQADILDFAPMQVALPAGGAVPLVDARIVTGRDFQLGLRAGPG